MAAGLLTSRKEGKLMSMDFYLELSSSIPILERGLRRLLSRPGEGRSCSGQGFTGVGCPVERSLGRSGILMVTHLENAGLAGGFCAGKRKEITMVSGLMTGLVALTLLKEGRKSRISSLGTGSSLILGGGLSNLMDRLSKGTVTDYIRIPSLPGKLGRLVFNFSDFCIIGGVFLSLLSDKNSVK